MTRTASRPLATTLIATATAIGLAFAGTTTAHAQGHVVTADNWDNRSAPALAPIDAGLARVISATPNIERLVETRQQCTEQWSAAPVSGGSGTAGTVVGALVGAAAGSAIGKGNGRLIAATAGGAIGAHVGRSMAEPAPAARAVTVCQPVSSVREQVRDYTVRYEWSGREYQVVMPQNPGSWLRVSTTHSVRAM
jgi:uncharacterized protein YcfJ